MALPTGMISLWSGAIVDIPAGWTLCDGDNGTPDLTDRFVLGAGGAESPGDTGGTSTHTHAGTTNGHQHSVAGPPDIWLAGSGNTDPSTINTDTFTTDPGNNLPPYYALAYIMKS